MYFYSEEKIYYKLEV